MRYQKKDMFPLTDNFGENLRKIRKSRCMTQDRLSDLTGLSRRTITRYETGDAKYASKEHVRKLSYCLGYDFDTYRINTSGLNQLADAERRCQSLAADNKHLNVENEQLKYQMKFKTEQLTDLQRDNYLLRMELERVKNLHRG